VQNRDQTAFIHAKMENVTAAAKAAAADIPDSLTFTLTNKPGPDSYPICGTVWAVLYQNQPADVGKTLVDFLRWITHEGQEHCTALHYARLPDELVRRVEKKLDSVKIGN
jgi:phosphate transport system substrate-binding protein